MTECAAPQWAGPAGPHAEAVHSILRMFMANLPNVHAVGTVVNGKSRGLDANMTIKPHDGGELADFVLPVGEWGDGIPLGDSPEETARRAAAGILEMTGIAGDREGEMRERIRLHFSRSD